MELALLKNRIKQNQSILKITNSLKVMSMTRLKNLKKNKENLIKYCEDIKNNILEINEEKINSEYMEIEEAPNNIFYINIFLFTDMSFCGTLNKQNENLLKKNTLDAYSLIIGFKGEKYGDIENNIEYLCKLYEKNLNKILFNKINEIINHKVKNYFTELIIRIYSYNGPIEINYINKEMNSSMKNLTYHEFYSKFLLNSCLLNYKYEECKTRLMKVTTAIKNSEKLNDELKILYNKKRQEMITKDLLEIISGSQVDSME